MSDARTAVLAFLEDFWRWKAPLADEADLFDVLEIEGDDAFEFMDPFVARFDVEAGDYRWYFHHGEEGWRIGALFFRPVHRRFGRIPITVAVLTEAVRTRRWPIADRLSRPRPARPPMGHSDQPALRGRGRDRTGCLGVDAIHGVGRRSFSP